MKPIVEELDRTLTQLDPPVAQQVEQLVRDALALAGRSSQSPTWPEGYFTRTAGALAGESFKRPDQGTPLDRQA